MKWIENLIETIDNAACDHVRETYPYYKGEDLEGGTKDSFMDGAQWVIKNIESLQVGILKKYITESEYKNLAESIDKPVIKLLKEGGVPFEKWGENINRLIQKELGLTKTTVYET